eukprot:2208955-Prymnesium_polylepis.1
MPARHAARPAAQLGLASVSHGPRRAACSILTRYAALPAAQRGFTFVSHSLRRAARSTLHAEGPPPTPP